MIQEAFETVAKTLDKAGVRYLVVGGLAVIAHGYVRLTTDIDIVLALDAQNIHRAFDALAEAGYRPSVPIKADGFGDAAQRNQWRKEKGMRVLNFFSPKFPLAGVDVFVYEPFDFALEYEKAMQVELRPDISVRFATVSALIRMKQEAGRAKDIDDIQHLRYTEENEGKSDG